MSTFQGTTIDNKGALDMNSSPYTISFRRVSKWFGNLVAVNEASFDITPGITGLVGPNGSGKTTILRMISGLASSSEGEVLLLGENPRLNTEIYKHIGVMSDHDAAYSEMTGQNFVRTIGRLRKVTDLTNAVNKVIRYVDLAHASTRSIDGYSRGMRQRIRLAAALVHDPDILIMDEPLNGADPKQRVEFEGLLKHFSSLGKTIIISSHILEEVEEITDNIIVIVSGKIAATGHHKIIRESLRDQPYSIRIICDPPRKLAAQLMEHVESIESVYVGEDHLVVLSKRPSELRAALPLVSQKAGVRLTGIVPLDDSLESVFGYLVS